MSRVFVRRSQIPVEAELPTVDRLDERQFEIAVKRLADALSYGTDRSPFLGSGIEYVQSRVYQVGDPVKAIDWKVTARTGRFHIKEFEAPKRMPVYLLIDTSASMVVGSARLSKYAWAVQVAGGIAFAALDRVSPVGVLGIGQRDFHIQPSLSRDQVLQWLYRLRRYRLDEPTSMGAKLGELAPSLPNRCLLVVLSDLHDPSGIPALKLAAQRHDCVAIQLQDPAETQPAKAGVFRAREAETGRTFATRAHGNWLDHEALGTDLRRAGVDHLVLRTDEPITHRLRNFLRARGLLGRNAR